MTLIQHSSASNEHYTPSDIIAATRETLGDIALDPCSCPTANGVVKASRIYTESDNGLGRPWDAATIFVNPPGGKIFGRSSAVVWYERACRAWFEGSSVVFLAFSLELLQSAQLSHVAVPPLLAPGICIPKRRIAFLSPNGMPQKSPSHANAVILLTSDAGTVGRFQRAFAPIGSVRV